MSRVADSAFFSWNTEHAPHTLVLRGDWTLDNYAALQQQIARFRAEHAGQAAPTVGNIDSQGLTALDTAGASHLLQLLGPDLAQKATGPQSPLSTERRALLRTVAAAMSAAGDPDSTPRTWLPLELLQRIGQSMEDTWRKCVALLGFMGLTLEALVRNLVRPKSWRVTAVVAQIEDTGLNAVPIVALLTFMVGAVIAFLGATVLADFGATIYTVNLVAFSFLREFAVLLTAILMAGRTASAFTAQLGSMKANEEIDAIRMLGLNPIDVLVLPRVLALLVSMPLLTFVGMMSGIFGGMLVCAVSLDISPTMFLTLFQESIQLRHFLLGMAKAPIFAFVIAIIGCLEGFKVSGSSQSVGAHTTSAVVQAIFIVILLDALAALFFMEMGW